MDEKRPSILSHPMIVSAAIIAIAIVVTAWLHRFEPVATDKYFGVVNKVTGETCTIVACWPFGEEAKRAKRSAATADKDKPINLLAPRTE